MVNNGWNSQIFRSAVVSFNSMPSVNLAINEFQFKTIANLNCKPLLFTQLT